MRNRRAVSFVAVLFALLMAAGCGKERPNPPPPFEPPAVAPDVEVAPPPPDFGSAKPTLHDARNQQSADAERAACIDRCIGEPDCLLGCEEKFKHNLRQ